jgi:hypothetical protein
MAADAPPAINDAPNEADPTCEQDFSAIATSRSPAAISTTLTTT